MPATTSPLLFNFRATMEDSFICLTSGPSFVSLLFSFSGISFKPWKTACGGQHRCVDMSICQQFGQTFSSWVKRVSECLIVLVRKRAVLRDPLQDSEYPWHRVPDCQSVNQPSSSFLPEFSSCVVHSFCSLFLLPGIIRS